MKRFLASVALAVVAFFGVQAAAAPAAEAAPVQDFCC